MFFSTVMLFIALLLQINPQSPDHRKVSSMVAITEIKKSAIFCPLLIMPFRVNNSHLINPPQNQEKTKFTNNSFGVLIYLEFFALSVPELCAFGNKMKFWCFLKDSQSKSIYWFMIYPPGELKAYVLNSSPLHDFLSVVQLLLKATSDKQKLQCKWFSSNELDLIRDYPSCRTKAQINNRKSRKQWLYSCANFLSNHKEGLSAEPGRGRGQWMNDWVGSAQLSWHNHWTCATIFWLWLLPHNTNHFERKKNK